MNEVQLIFSQHAREQMVARGISINEVMAGIKRGSKALQNPNRLLFYYQYFCVVCKKVDNYYFIITVKPR